MKIIPRLECILSSVCILCDWLLRWRGFTWNVLLGFMNGWRMIPQTQIVHKSKECLLNKFLHAVVQFHWDGRAPTEFTDSVLKPKRGTLGRSRWSISWLVGSISGSLSDVMIQTNYSCFMPRRGSSWLLDCKLGELSFYKLGRGPFYISLRLFQ